MAQIDVIRHEIRQHNPANGEEYDPAQDMLIVVHRNPNDPDDPVEWGHHIRLAGLAYRKEMWGTPDYASTIDMELKDLERYHARTDPDEDYGTHPLATITEHYFEGPRARMTSFNPAYVFSRVESALTAIPSSTDGVVQMCIDTVISGVVDVKGCLASGDQHTFPCKGMTGLSTDTVGARDRTSTRMEAQTQRLDLVSSAPLDAVRQMLTDREAELEHARETFVNYALLEGNVPEIMRKRVAKAAVQRGILEENTWM